MRRVLVILLLLAVVATTVWTLLRWNRTAPTSADPWSVIPDRSAVILELPDAWETWDRFTHTSQFWGDLETMPSMLAIGKLMAATTERAENDAALREALNDVTLLLALVRTGNEQVDVLLACSPRAVDGMPMHSFGELLKVDEAAQKTLRQGGTIQCRPDTSLPPLSVSIHQGVWLLASSPAMMDEALLQVKNGTSIRNEPFLKAALSTLGAGADAHVLVHLERAKALLHTWWTPATIDDLDLPKGWVAMDLRARPDAFLLSGLIIPEEPHAMLLSVGGQGTGRNDLSRWLPDEVVSWDVREINEPELFLRSINVASDSVITALGPNLFHWVRGNIAIAQNADTTGNAPRVWALFQTDDPEEAALKIRQLCPDGVTCDTLSHRGTRLTELPLNNAHERLLGEAYAGLHEPWWCMLGDVVVFASSSEALRTAVDAWNDGRTLAEDARTSRWSDLIASTAGRTIRWDVARSWRSFGKGMKADAATRYIAERTTLMKVGGLAIQLSPAQHGRTHIAIGVEHAPAEERSTGIHWSTPLPPGTTRKPDIVRNHTNNTREVLVQDGEHRIHLLGSSGKVLWNYVLDGPILGEVHQVDRFKNGKLQLLLNTAGHIYLIDRNGKDVGGFPIALPARATAPLAVFDYEGNKDYRVVVPLQDGRLLNYGMEGSATTGWEPQRSSAPVVNSIRHLRIKNKDHLLVCDGAGPVKVLDRRGAEREQVSLRLEAGARVLNVAPGLELAGTRITWADTTGAVYVATLNGSPERIASAGHNLLGNLADDGIFDIIRTAGDSVVVTHAGAPVFARRLGGSVAPDVQRYTINGATLFGLFLYDREEVLLLDDRGNMVRGLPLRGATPFSIADLDLDGTLELVTVTADGHVIAYNALPAGSPVR